MLATVVTMWLYGGFGYTSNTFSNAELVSGVSSGKMEEGFRLYKDDDSVFSRDDGGCNSDGDRISELDFQDSVENAKRREEVIDYVGENVDEDFKEKIVSEPTASEVVAKKAKKLKKEIIQKRFLIEDSDDEEEVPPLIPIVQDEELVAEEYE